MLGLDSEILHVLSMVDDIVISMCTVRRILKCMGLYRGKKSFLLPLEVASFLIDQLEAP